MNKNEVAELFKYCSPNSILVLSWRNRLIELHCPFAVRVKANIGDLKKGQKKYVEKVKLSSSGVSVFMVKGKAYYYHHFDILLIAV